MTNPFDSIIAKEYCKRLITNLENYSFLDFELPEEKRNPTFSTKSLFEKAGCMFGVLVCKNEKGKEIVLKAFSGQYESNWVIEGWCEPLLDIDEYNELVSITDPEIQEITKKIALLDSNSHEYSVFQKQRSTLSHNAFKKIQELYAFTCANGIQKKFKNIVTDFIPTGTGDCCAPKLLNAAFKMKLQPISMAEFYFGKETKTKKHLDFYDPCDEKCKLILTAMLQLEILYKDENIIVVNKQAGLLSVPGRGEDNQDCIVNRIKKLYPECIDQPSIHRLDMDTSGIMVFALTGIAHKTLSKQFENREVKKKYIAVLDGNIVDKGFRIGDTGRIKLPFRLDIENRPFQIYDEKNGKMGITDYTILSVKKNKGFKTCSPYVTYIEYSPLTGRTHQLRLHSMHEKGLGLPIVGDRLYGDAKDEYENRFYGTNGVKEGRLLLHASYLEFIHPITKEKMIFQSKPDF